MYINLMSVLCSFTCMDVHVFQTKQLKTKQLKGSGSPAVPPADCHSRAAHAHTTRTPFKAQHDTHKGIPAAPAGYSWCCADRPPEPSLGIPKFMLGIPKVNLGIPELNL